MLREQARAVCAWTSSYPDVITLMTVQAKADYATAIDRLDDLVR